MIAGLSIGSRESVLAIALCLAASLGSFLLWINERHLRRGTQPRFWLSKAYLRNVIKTDGRHRLSLPPRLVPATLYRGAILGCPASATRQ